MTIDLRSDTVTRPSVGMLDAMRNAEVGDDIYGEDPTARRLEEEIAERLGKGAALFVASGTMGNQIALMHHCRPGDDVVIGEDAHCQLYESGGAGALAGVQLSVAGAGGMFTAEELEAALYPASAYYMPRTRLVTLENTHNRAGGAVWPVAQMNAVCKKAQELGLATHLDGARLFNAAVACDVSLASLAAPFDTVSVCFSKGLGAPVGSALAGSVDAIEHARRLRKMLGGAMRQVGILCAGALYALEHNVDRIDDDHSNALRLARGLQQIDGVTVDLDGVQTNIVNYRVADSPSYVAKAAEAGVLINAMAAGRIRAVTHLDVDAAAIDTALERLLSVSGL